MTNLLEDLPSVRVCHKKTGGHLPRKVVREPPEGRKKKAVMVLVHKDPKQLIAH